jgi:hypothetical protein
LGKVKFLGSGRYWGGGPRFQTPRVLQLHLFAWWSQFFADGHTASNAPDLFRPPKLSGAGPGQYWGGGPPGKTLGCCQLLLRSRRPCAWVRIQAHANSWTRPPCHKLQLHLFAWWRHFLADGHTASNAPDLFRPPKLSGAGPGQYWGGGPPGKTLGCCQLFIMWTVMNSPGLCLHVATGSSCRNVGHHSVHFITHQSFAFY